MAVLCGKCLEELGFRRKSAYLFLVQGASGVFQLVSKGMLTGTWRESKWLVVEKNRKLSEQSSRVSCMFTIGS